MFCSHCGTALQPDFNVCPKCGQLLRTPVVGAAEANRMERHIHILGTLWMIAGALFLIPATVLLIIGSAAHIAIHGNPLVGLLGPLVVNIIGGTFLLLAAGGIMIGEGLRNRRPWARIAALVLGTLALFHPPIGTALGIYTLWVLLSRGADAQYQQLAGIA